MEEALCCMLVCCAFKWPVRRKVYTKEHRREHFFFLFRSRKASVGGHALVSRARAHESGCHRPSMEGLQLFSCLDSGATTRVYSLPICYQSRVKLTLSIYYRVGARFYSADLKKDFSVVIKTLFAILHG